MKIEDAYIYYVVEQTGYGKTGCLREHAVMVRLGFSRVYLFVAYPSSRDMVREGKAIENIYTSTGAVSACGGPHFCCLDGI